MPCCRHSSGTGVPPSACFNTAMIWLSLNRDFFMEPPRVRLRENSTSGFNYFPGGLPIVGAQHLRQSVIALQLLEDAHQPLRGDRRIHLDVQRLAVEVIDHVEGPEAAAARQRVGY